MPWAGTDAGSPIRMWQVRPRRRLGACSYPVVTVGTGSMMSVTSIYEEIEIELKKIANYAVPVVLSWADSYSITCNILFYFIFTFCTM